jgi:putative membrane protein
LDQVNRSSDRIRWPTRPHRVGTPGDPRFSLANERTFLAWNRTALALVGGGLAASQLLRVGIGAARPLIALPLIALGAAAAIVGVFRWRAYELAMRLRATLPRSRVAPALLATGAGAIAVLSIVLLVLGEVRS